MPKGEYAVRKACKFPFFPLHDSGCTAYTTDRADAGGDLVTVRRYICPYGKDEREAVAELSVRQIEVPLVILTCDNMCEDIKKDTLVSRGSLLGYKDETPVYASIDGIITHIAKRRESYAKGVWDITVERYHHARVLWSEIPFFEGSGGDYFLRQLGIKGGHVKKAKTIYINAVSGEPWAAANYCLLVQETAKAVLGAGVLGRCMQSEKIVFYIERGWHTADFLLNKYIGKYKSIAGGAVFEVWYIKRRYPLEIVFNKEAVFDVQTAVWAYQGAYEHEPALDVCVAVSVNGTKNDIKSDVPEETAVLKFPVGTRIEDALLCAGIEAGEITKKRFVLGGPLHGRAAAPNEAVGGEIRQLCVFEENMAAELGGQMASCIGCHLCERHCPVRVIPYLLNEETLGKCIGCNVCSYICPAEISLGERIRRAGRKKKTVTGRAPGREKADRTGCIIAKEKKKRKKAAHYITLPADTDILAAVQKSDAPPHIHSHYNCVRAYSTWILALALPIFVKIAAQVLDTKTAQIAAGRLPQAAVPGTMAAAGQIVFAAFFFMAFHEILSGFFPSFFYKSHLLKGVADGLTVGLVLPPAVPVGAIMAAGFFGVFGEKLLFRYKIGINTPALTAAVLLLMYAPWGERLYALLWWEAAAMSAAVLIGGILLWLSGYLYAVPAAAATVIMTVVLKVPLAETLVISVFFLQRWQQGGTGLLQRIKWLF